MERGQKHILGLVLTIVIVAAAKVASAAPAQTFEALLAQYGLDVSDAQVQARCLALEESAQALGAQISVEGLYCDGERLLTGWKTENTEPEQPVLVLYTDVRIGGISVGYMAYADYPVSLWWPQVFGLSVTGDFLYNSDKRL